MTGNFQAVGTAGAAQDRGIARGHLARRLGQPRLARRQTGALGGERHFKVRRLRDRAQTRRNRALERLGRRFLRSGAELGIRRRHFSLIARRPLTAVVPAKAGTHNHGRSLFPPTLAPSLYRNSSAYWSPPWRGRRPANINDASSSPRSPT